MSETELEMLISQIRNRHAEVRSNSSQYNSFIAHLRALASWEREPMDYPEVNAYFPESICLAYAVCHPDCGVMQVIVDGSTQECQRCGRLMFRTAIKEYKPA